MMAFPLSTTPSSSSSTTFLSFDLAILLCIALALGSIFVSHLELHQQIKQALQRHEAAVSTITYSSYSSESKNNHHHHKTQKTTTTTTTTATTTSSGGSTNNYNLPLPLQILEQYKQWHSENALIRDINNNNDRKFTLAYYECPLSAGNRLHEFINDFLLSVLSNRTLLWKYYDKNTCEQRPQRGSIGTARTQMSNCTLHNSLEECESIIKRESWIPSYDKWSKILRFEDGKETPYQIINPNLNKVNLKEIMLMHRVVVFYPETASKDYNEVVADLLRTEWASTAAKDMYSLGIRFLYGAAFRLAFDFSDQIKSTIPTVGSHYDADADGAVDFVSIAVHSRHTDPRDTGCNVTRELQCANRLLLRQQQQQVSARRLGKPCRAFVMADRKCTISQLRISLGEKCEVYVANHDDAKSGIADHGDFASAGYFQDLATVTSHARHGLVVAHVPGQKIRTSSALIMEIIEYNRKMEALGAGLRHPSQLVEDMGICKYVELHRAANMWRNDRFKKKKKMMI